MMYDWDWESDMKENAYEPSPPLLVTAKDLFKLVSRDVITRKWHFFKRMMIVTPRSCFSFCLTHEQFFLEVLRGNMVVVDSHPVDYAEYYR